MRAVAERLAGNPELFTVPVVAGDGTPLGLLNRFRFLERLSQRFGRDLLLRRPVGDCLESDPLLIDRDTPVEDVGARLFADAGTHILDGFIVTSNGRYCGIGTGVTLTRALTELTVQRMRDEVDRAARQNSAKSTFIANVSHELRTPLNGVVGISALLLDTRLDDDQQDLVGLLRASGEALLTLIDDVLDYARIETSRFELDCVVFDPRTILADATRILSTRARGKVLEVTSVVDDSVPARLAGDAGRFRQVLLNLGGNAIKFTERGHVRFTLGAERGPADAVRLVARVEDTGIGIPAHRIGTLCQPFVQADATIGQPFGGTGLGLAICREIVERMGGTFTVDSEPGRGSTFSFSVQLTACDDVPDVASVPSPLQFAGPQPAAAADMRVLVAEDNAVNQLVATRLLARLGCVTAAAGDGRAAIDALAAGDFDLVLMDCHMPELDGLEATRRIRAGAAGERGRRVPIVALTASANTESRTRCLAAGMDGYLTKPITPAALERELARWRRLDRIRKAG
jgi:two-component system, sensor histidine kinase